jgi:hypothetical protein
MKSLLLSRIARDVQRTLMAAQLPHVRIDDFRFIVFSGSRANVSYVVDVADESCTCDAGVRGVPCRHLECADWWC